MPPDIHGLGHDVMPGDAGDPTRRRQKARQDADGGGLAGPVGPQEADNFPAVDPTADVIHREDGAEIFGEIVNLNHHERPVTAQPTAAPDVTLPPSLVPRRRKDAARGRRDTSFLLRPALPASSSRRR